MEFASLFSKVYESDTRVQTIFDLRWSRMLIDIVQWKNAGMKCVVSFQIDIKIQIQTSRDNSMTKLSKNKFPQTTFIIQFLFCPIFLFMFMFSLKTFNRLWLWSIFPQNGRKFQISLNVRMSNWNLSNFWIELLVQMQ